MRRGFLGNSKGLSVLFLLVAMLLMVTMGYVLTYLLPTKHKSVIFPIHSTQAFFLAQSGVEFAIRYAADQGWTTPASLLNLNGPGVNQRSLGKGIFTVTYDNINDRLTSVGEIPNLSERSIILSAFTSFVSKGLILFTPLPCWTNPRTVLRFYIRNSGGSNITLGSFSASWNEPPVRTLTSILMTGVQRFSGSYGSGSGIRNFTPPGSTQVIGPNQTIMVNMTWAGNISPNGPFTISFYDPSGGEYSFNLDPENDGFPSCP